MDLLLILKDLVEQVVHSVVEHPSQVQVSHTLKGTRAVTFEVVVAPSDIGRVLGEGGSVINSIRTLAEVAGAQHGLNVRVEVV